MPRTILILGLLVLALGAAVTMLLWRPADGLPNAVPLQRLTPANRTGPDAQSPAPHAAAVTGTSTDTTRTAAVVAQDATSVGGAAAERTSVLRVRLLDDLDQPVPHHEVSLRHAADPAAGTPQASPQSQRSDAAGQLQFVIPRPDPRGAARVMLHSPSLGWIEADLPEGPRLELTLRLQPRCWVHGLVIAADGSPVADATLVYLRPDPEVATAATPDGTALRPTRELGRSDRLGRFRIGLVSNGLLGAEHPHLAPSALQRIAAPGRDEPVREIELRLQLLTVQSRIHGTTVSATGQPLTGVQLEFRAQEPAGSRWPQRPPQVGSSDALGRFAIANLVPGEVCWTARAPGHGGSRGRLALQPGQTSDLQIVLAEPATVHGSVRTANGGPVAGARLVACLEGSQSAGARAAEPDWCAQALAVSTVSRADGSYELTDLPPGKLRITVDGPAATPGSARTSLELLAGQTQPWQAVLEAPKPALWLRGEVVDAAYRNCPGRTVVLLQDGAPPQLTSTDADGRFRFDLPVATAARLLLLAAGGNLRSFHTAQLQLPSPAMAEVRLVEDAAVDRVRLHGNVHSQGLEPLPATVTVWHAGLQRAAQVTADANGQFAMEAVPVGKIEVTVAHPGHATSRPIPIELRSGTDVDLGAIMLAPAGSMHGSVHGPDGQPPTELEVFVITDDEAVVPGEYAGGQYRINLLPAGRHRLHVQGPQVAAATFAIEIQPEVDLQQDMRLLAGMRRPFVIEGEAAAGNRWTLLLRQPGEREQWLAQSPRPANGNAAFVAWLAPGDYEAIAFSNEGWRAMARVTITAGEESPVRLQLRRP